MWSLWQNHYRIYLNYPRGALYYRVRPLGRFTDGVEAYSHVRRGPWSTVKSYTITSGFEEALNWATSVSYGEEGKKKQVTSFIDGGGRSRQSQTYLNTEELTAVAGYYYDHEGAGVLSVLPSMDLGADLSYRSLLNRDDSNGELTAKDWDNDLTTPALSDDYGAGRYYSEDNGIPQINRNYIPDADGYVYSRTIYERDGTGRIKIQTGLGADHKAGIRP